MAWADAGTFSCCQVLSCFAARDTLCLKGFELGPGRRRENIFVVDYTVQVNPLKIGVLGLVGDQGVHESIKNTALFDKERSGVEVCEGSHVTDGLGKHLHVTLLTFFEPGGVPTAVDRCKLRQSRAVAQCSKNYFAFSCVFVKAEPIKVNCLQHG